MQLSKLQRENQTSRLCSLPQNRKCLWVTPPLSPPHVFHQKRTSSNTSRTNHGCFGARRTCVCSCTHVCVHIFLTLHFSTTPGCLSERRRPSVSEDRGHRYHRDGLWPWRLGERQGLTQGHPYWDKQLHSEVFHVWTGIKSLGNSRSCKMCFYIQPAVAFAIKNRVLWQIQSFGWAVKTF
jgi:hypothetical protein